MPVVIELTLTTRPGHFDQALQSYLEFVNNLENVIEDLTLALIGAEPAQSTIHAVGIYQSAQVAEDVASLPFFADMVDALTPHLADAPERTESELLKVTAVQTDVRLPDPGQATLVEMAFRAKLGHVDEVAQLREDFSNQLEASDHDAAITLFTAQRAAGNFRAILFYTNHDDATAEGVTGMVGDFFDRIEPLLADAPRRSELHIVHAFARA